LTSALDRAPAPREVLLSAIAQSPPVRAATADIDQARADVRLGQAMRRPEVGARLSVRRDQDDHIVTGGVSITLPAFNHGQAVAGEAEARQRRLARERDAARAALEVEVTAGLSAYLLRREAAELLRDVALPAADDNESLAARSLDAGQISLMDFLLVRQDVARARLDYLEALTDAALAAVEIDASAGVLR
jgi:cobalt-zinc-cadmium efflux system outer membrane protein